MAEYFDAEHAREVAALEASLTARTEWPTWLLIAAVYGGWAATVLLVRAHTLSLGAATPLLVVLCTLHMSMQHELLHGHPTRFAALNKLLGYPPLAIWFPYTLYRDTHLEHHRDEALTLPGLDPESNYVPAARWRRWPAWRRALWHARKRFVGRMVVGPPMSAAAVLAAAWRALRERDRRYAPMWLAHLLCVAALLAALDRWAGVPWWYYLLAVSWPALSLATIRSLYEHRAAPDPKARIVINEAGFVMRLLFLNNNYHLVHHDLPSLAWYCLPGAYRLRRDAYAVKSGHFVIRGGYRELLRLYAWRATDAPVHPYWPRASASAAAAQRAAAQRPAAG
ncbi:fatty acid desaturase [Paraburkholderia pallida]|uniref:Aminotransferase n=1 Tax=Paraburkholderia pallida TaxID=2547399 RepID=A0A4P7CYC1_9BURK|nr:fatty acid desaturase [Paraburkholderia pallida]QBR01286.1 aminotransferase [Paraburkholderia pallida]